MKLNKIFANYFTCLFDQSLFIFSTGIKLQGEKKNIQKKNKTNPFNTGSQKNRFLYERKKKRSEPQSSP